MRCFGKEAFLLMALLSGIARDAGAAVITAVSLFDLPGFSTGSLGPIGGAPDPNNDNAVGPSANAIPSMVFLNTFGTTEIELELQSSGGTTEYLFTQVLINNTGQTWTDYHFELGFGTGAAFARSSLFDDLDFDAPDADPPPVSSVFLVLNHGPDALDWSGGTVPAVSTVFFSFAIDVPDALEAFHPLGLNRFTMRHTPTVVAVSEPWTLLLIGAGLAAAAAKRRARS
jgi:hypothetical protein